MNGTNTKAHASSIVSYKLFEEAEVARAQGLHVYMKYNPKA